MNLTVVIDPSDDHVSSGAAVLLRETEPDIAKGLHLDLEGNVPLAGRPEHQEIVVQNGAVLPFDGDGAGDEQKKERADHSLHLYRSKHLKARGIPEATCLVSGGNLCYLAEM